jgi:hypothetical protein
MWQVEASNAKGDFQIVSSLSQAASRKLHRELSNSGKWAMVRSFDMDSVLRKAEADAWFQAWGGDARIRAWGGRSK